MKKAIILCSGGLDSVVTSYYVKNQLKYQDIIILFYNYGQKSLKQERKSAKNCASKLKAKFIEINLDWLGKISNSLINKNGQSRKLDKKDLKNTKEESEKFYVPCRNTIFITYALALAESEYIKNKIESAIFVGFKCEGKESYPDTTLKFVKQMNNLSKTSCVKAFKIHAPLIKKDKEDIILLGRKLGVDLKSTFSCYLSSNKNQCGQCLACALRKAGFYWANIADPTDYLK